MRFIGNIFYVPALAVLASFLPCVALAQEYEGRVVAEWLTDQAGRQMRLIESFSFVDTSGVKWTAPAFSIVDGASIPSIFWSNFGPPFVGKYRRASVIHDVYCERRDREHRKVHKMFYDAAITDGVDRSKARLMYLAIRAFGPKWEHVETIGLEGKEVLPVDVNYDLDVTFNDLKTRVELEDLDIEGIDKLISELEKN